MAATPETPKAGLPPELEPALARIHLINEVLRHVQAATDATRPLEEPGDARNKSLGARAGLSLWDAAEALRAELERLRALPGMPHLQGREANAGGQRSRENPYPKGHWCHEEWFDGWCAAQAEREFGEQRSRRERGEGA